MDGSWNSVRVDACASDLNLIDELRASLHKALDAWRAEVELAAAKLQIADGPALVRDVANQFGPKSSFNDCLNDAFFDTQDGLEREVQESEYELEARNNKSERTAYFNGLV